MKKHWHVAILMSLVVWIAGRTAAADETAYDRPAGAAVYRRMFAVGEVWVFACGADHVMRSKTKVFDDPWGPWTTVTTTGCASAPSAVKWNNDSSEAMGVYFRSTTNRLIEAWYPASGGGPEISDLSNQAGLGNISGMPTVADHDSDAGNVALIVTRANTNLIYSLDLYNSAWHLQPVRESNNAQAVSAGSVFATSYDLAQPFFSARTSTNGQTIYSRTSWTQPYRYFFGPITPATAITPDGLVTFAAASQIGQRCNLICATFPTTASTLGVIDLVTKSYFHDLTYGSPSATFPNGSPGFSVFSPSDAGLGFNVKNGWGRTSTGTLQLYDFVLNSSTRVVSTTSIDSAPSPMVSGSADIQATVFATLAAGQYGLHILDLDFRPNNEVSLAYPGAGVLAP